MEAADRVSQFQRLDIRADPRMIPRLSACLALPSIMTDAAPQPECKPLGYYVENCVRDYLRTLDGAVPAPLYETLIEEFERPLLREVMAHCEGNNTRAATVLGINRATLRKKLQKYNIAE